MNITLNTNNTNFNGKIIYKNKISKDGQELLNNFLAIKKDGKTNLQIIKKKSNDLYVSEQQGHLTLSTNFKKLFLNNPIKYYLVGLKKKENSDYTIESNFFRWGLKTFQEYKKDLNGYNNTFEKVKAIFNEIY